jgi:hypothetical protein
VAFLLASQLCLASSHAMPHAVEGFGQVLSFSTNLIKNAARSLFKEEIADNTTYWCLFCTEPQHVFIFAENTTFCYNHLHKTHNLSLAALITN